MNVEYMKMTTKMLHKQFTLLNPTKSARNNLSRLKLRAILLLGLGLTGLQAQTMYVKQSDDTQAAYALINIRKVAFSSGDLTVTKTDNSSGVYALSDLRYLNFSDMTTSLDETMPVQSQMLSVYPNPVSNTLNIELTESAQEQGTLSILSFEGKTLVSRQVRNVGVISIDVSYLPSGVYLCSHSSATEVKTVKIVKY